MFAMLVYGGSAITGGSTDFDQPAVVDPEFSRRNSHYIFSEPYKLLAAHALGASLTKARFSVPSWNAIGRFNIWPLELSATPLSFRRIMDLRERQPPIPVNEEIAMNLTNNLATSASEKETAAIWVGTPDWNRNFPSGQGAAVPLVSGDGYVRRMIFRATASVTTIANSWSNLTAVTFDDNLRGGWYCVHSCFVQSSNARYFRLVFPRMPLYRGRRLRPGSIVSNATGNIEAPISEDYWGVWGYFHSFEPFQIEEFADSATTDSITIFFDATYYGTTAPAGYAPTGAELQ